jgi:hypothetical protein
VLASSKPEVAPGLELSVEVSELAKDVFLNEILD